MHDTGEEVKLVFGGEINEKSFREVLRFYKLFYKELSELKNAAMITETSEIKKATHKVGVLKRHLTSMKKEDDKRVSDAIKDQRSAWAELDHQTSLRISKLKSQEKADDKARKDRSNREKEDLRQLQYRTQAKRKIRDELAEINAAMYKDEKSKSDMVYRHRRAELARDRALNAEKWSEIGRQSKLQQSSQRVEDAIIRKAKADIARRSLAQSKLSYRLARNRNSFYNAYDSSLNSVIDNSFLSAFPSRRDPSQSFIASEAIRSFKLGIKIRHADDTTDKVLDPTRSADSGNLSTASFRKHVSAESEYLAKVRSMSAGIQASLIESQRRASFIRKADAEEERIRKDQLKLEEKKRKVDEAIAKAKHKELERIKKEEALLERRRVGASFAGRYAARSAIPTGEDYVGYGLKQKVSQYLGFLGAMTAGGYVSNKFIEQERLMAMLKVQEGAGGNANKSFSWMQRFAIKSPFDLQGTIEAYSMLKALGIQGNEKMFGNLGNLAAANGANLFDLIDALNSVKSGHATGFERQFKQSVEYRDKKIYITASDGKGGVRKVAINKDEDTFKNLVKYAEDLGKTRYAGGMDIMARSLPGQINNLTESISKLSYDVGRGGASQRMADQVGRLVDLVSSNKNASAFITKGVDVAQTMTDKAIDIASSKGAPGVLKGILFGAVMAKIFNSIVKMFTRETLLAPVGSLLSAEVIATGVSSIAAAAFALIANELVDAAKGKITIFGKSNRFALAGNGYSPELLRSMAEPFPVARQRMFQRSSIIDYTNLPDLASIPDALAFEAYKRESSPVFRFLDSMFGTSSLNVAYSARQPLKEIMSGDLASKIRLASSMNQYIAGGGSMSDPTSVAQSIALADKFGVSIPGINKIDVNVTRNGDLIINGSTAEEMKASLRKALSDEYQVLEDELVSAIEAMEQGAVNTSGAR